jgi:hypothetical protein
MYENDVQPAKTWRMASDSNPNKFYVIDLSDQNNPSCTCVSFAIKRNRAIRDRQPIPNCKHIERVLSEVSWALQEEEAEIEREFERIRAQESLSKILRGLE